MTLTLPSPIAEWRDTRRQRAARQSNQLIADEFDIVEHLGSIYLTHCGVAFDCIDPATPATDIADRINAARQTAIIFHNARQR